MKRRGREEKREGERNWMTYRLFHSVRDPSVLQHGNHGGGRVVKIIESIQEDKVHCYVIHIHTYHLGNGQ